MSEKDTPEKKSSVTEESVIKAVNAGFSYKKRDENGDVISSREAVRDVSLQIFPGEFVALLGSNGSGKSSFARLLNALYLPDRGEVYTGGMDTKDSRLTFKIRKTCGMIFQNPDNQIISSTVEEDVAFGPENIGIPREEMEVIVDECLKKTGLAEKKHSSPHKLSGGEKQRLAIAGVLAMRPRCIVFDEPTAMLDPEGRRDVMNIIKDLREEGITVVLITHFPEETVNCDRIFIMKKGNVVKSGSPEEIYSDTEFLKENGLRPPFASDIAGVLRRHGVHIKEGITDVDELAEETAKLIKTENDKEPA